MRESPYGWNARFLIAPTIAACLVLLLLSLFCTQPSLWDFMTGAHDLEMRRAKTLSNASSVARAIVEDHRAGPERHENAFIDPADLSVDEAVRLDAWGQPMSVRSRPDGVAVISSGPDGRFFTDDDIQVHLPWR